MYRTLYIFYVFCKEPDSKFGFISVFLPIFQKILTLKKKLEKNVEYAHICTLLVSTCVLYLYGPESYYEGGGGADFSVKLQTDDRRT